ncbi:hypothetical protein [Rubrivirga sp.]|uniref:hypothetical protein n=1 Tax=Rubrivirga sp. TaxID=1885344 RepID=UPI003C73A277
MRSVLFLALLLSGCQADQESPSRPAPGSAPPDQEALPDAAMLESVTIGQTLSLVDGYADASPSIAIQTLELWSSRLDTLALEGDMADTLAALRRDLETLQGELQSSPLVGRPIGTTLRSMGRRTTVLAEGRSELEALGQALSSAGRVLAPVSPDSTGVSTDEDSSVQ